MPELPEVQTTVNGLNKKVKGKTIADVWTDIAVTAPKLPHHLTSTKSAAFFKISKKLLLVHALLALNVVLKIFLSTFPTSKAFGSI